MIPMNWLLSLIFILQHIYIYFFFTLNKERKHSTFKLKNAIKRQKLPGGSLSNSYSQAA